MKNPSFRNSLILSLLFVAIFAMGLPMGIAQNSPRKTFHDFVVKDIFGDPFDLRSLAGKKVMVVNTASRCGLTPQFEQLEALYRAYSSQGLVVIGFPANNFMNQEPGTNEEILAFCQENFGVTFPMMSRISVRGDDIAPVFQWLTQKEQNGVMDAEVRWNFQKFLINPDGSLADVLMPRERADSEKVIQWIEGR